MALKAHGVSARQAKRKRTPVSRAKRFVRKLLGLPYRGRKAPTWPGEDDVFHASVALGGGCIGA